MTLSKSIQYVKSCPDFINEIKNGCFNFPFTIIFGYYQEIIDIEPIDSFPDSEQEAAKWMRPLFIGYKNILDGRSPKAILLKLLVIKSGVDISFLPLGKIVVRDEADLNGFIVSNVMALFVAIAAENSAIDLRFCSNIWLFNFIMSPVFYIPSGVEEQKNIFNQYKVGEFKGRFNEIYKEFRDINLLLTYVRPIAEVNMGLIARICDLTIDIVELIESHKSEIADLTFRALLESFILGSWLVLKREPENYARFIDFSTGKDKFMSDKLAEMATDKIPETIIDKIKGFGADAIKESGSNATEVAAERGDAFNTNTAAMADEVWGKDNMQYMFYRRMSETTHGSWRVIKKYHLAKSFNPLHNGLLSYDIDSDKINGLHTPFLCMIYASEFMISILQDVQEMQEGQQEELVDSLFAKISEFYDEIFAMSHKYNMELALANMS